MGDTARFFAAEFFVFEVNVVNDLTDGVERRIGKTGSRQENFESAAVALMSEFGLEHIEAQLARLRGIAFARHELEPGILVNKTADEPGRCDPVDIHVLSGYPDPGIERANPAASGR